MKRRKNEQVLCTCFKSAKGAVNTFSWVKKKRFFPLSISLIGPKRRKVKMRKRANLKKVKS